MEFSVKQPILGFENIKTYKLIPIDEVFMRLDAIGAQTSFTLVNPYALRDYQFNLPATIKALLDIKEDSELLILNIMIVHTPLEDSKINFIAPIIFNVSNQTMAQTVLDHNIYKDYQLSDPISNYISLENK